MKKFDLTDLEEPVAEGGPAEAAAVAQRVLWGNNPESLKVG